ncbi:protein nrt1/ ptr family 7.3 [Quercus suber]|uniref:Protein nrt1/ ptr family 7.3 n=1 Tax=Quercus suber TaxID=58331 RepID=A0AAW0K6S4_QUESU
MHSETTSNLDLHHNLLINSLHTNGPLSSWSKLLSPLPAKYEGSSSLSIFWQIPQYAFVGASEVFMYFFNAQTPNGLKSFGSTLCLLSISLRNYMSILLVSMVMNISTKESHARMDPRS